MFEFTESIRIDAPLERVWEVLRDVDNWWLKSNTEHELLEQLDERSATEVGARLRIKEKIGGIPGEAVGAITAVAAGEAVTWEADAVYRWLGFSVPVQESVTWRIEPRGDDCTELSAHVWAEFARSGVGRVAAFAFASLLDGVAKDRRHTRTELEYLKRAIESPGASDDQGRSPIR